MPRRSKSTELLDFEIVFYEKLLQAYPDFIDALLPLGTAYTRRGLYEKGLAIDLKLTHLRGDDPMTWYNLACSYSLLKRVDDAMSSLRRSFELGYTDVRHLQQDPDLVTLRQSQQYRQFLEAFASTAAAKASPPPPAGPASAPPPA